MQGSTKSFDHHCSPPRKIIFDSLGFIAEEHLNESDEHEKTLYHYAANHTLTRIEKYDAAGALHLTYLFFYDAKGNEIEQRVVGASHTTIHQNTYDREGRIIQLKSFGLKDGVIRGTPSIHSYRYDSFGNCTLEKRQRSDGTLDSTVHVYQYDKSTVVTERLIEYY